MSIFEYDKEEEEKKLRRAEFEAGYESAKREMALEMKQNKVNIHSPGPQYAALFFVPRQYIVNNAKKKVKIIIYLAIFLPK